MQDGKLPVLLEYLSCRQDESRQRDFQLNSYFLNHGHVVARVDIRGTCSSEGLVIN